MQCFIENFYVHCGMADQAPLTSPDASVGDDSKFGDTRLWCTVLGY